MFSKTLRDPDAFNAILSHIGKDSDEDDNELTLAKNPKKGDFLFEGQEPENQEKIEKSRNKYLVSRRQEKTGQEVSLNKNEKPVVDIQNEDNLVKMLKSRIKITDSRRRSKDLDETSLEKLLNEPLEIKSKENMQNISNFDKEIVYTKKEPLNKSSEEPRLKNKIVSDEIFLRKKDHLDNTNELKTEDLNLKKSNENIQKNIFSTPKKDLNTTYEVEPITFKSSNKNINEKCYTQKEPLDLTHEYKPKVIILNSPKYKKSIKNKFKCKSAYSMPKLSEIDHDRLKEYTCAKDLVDMAYLGWYKQKTTELLEQRKEENKIKETILIENYKKKTQLEMSAKTAFDVWKKNRDQEIRKRQREDKLEIQKKDEKKLKKQENIINAEKSFDAWLELKKNSKKLKKVKKENVEAKPERSKEEIRILENKKTEMEKRWGKQQSLNKKKKEEKREHKQEKETQLLRKDMESQKIFEDWLEKKEKTKISNKLLDLGPWIPPKKIIPN